MLLTTNRCRSVRRMRTALVSHGVKTRRETRISHQWWWCEENTKGILEAAPVEICKVTRKLPNAMARQTIVEANHRRLYNRVSLSNSMVLAVRRKQMRTTATPFPRLGRNLQHQICKISTHNITAQHRNLLGGRGPHYSAGQPIQYSVQATCYNQQV